MKGRREMALEKCCGCGASGLLVDGRCYDCEQARLERVEAARAAYAVPLTEEETRLVNADPVSVLAEMWKRCAPLMPVVNADNSERVFLMVSGDPPRGGDPGSTAWRSNVPNKAVLANALRELADKIDCPDTLPAMPVEKPSVH